MIKPHATFEVCRIPLRDLMVTEYEQRHPERVLRYVEMLRAHPLEAPGFLSVQRRGDRLEILDGHHRFCAHILAGRTEALCIVIQE